MEKTESASESRRKRVNRIKKTIIAILMILIITPTVLCIWLAFRVSSLEDKLDSIMNSSLFVERDNSQKSSNTSTKVENSAKQTNKSEEKETVKDKETQTAEQKQSASSGKKVYLTFDDGPSNNTDTILEILDKYKVKATFFVTYHSGDDSAQRYKDIVNNGHTIGIHSYTHDYDLVYKNLDSFKKDVLDIQEFVYDTTGVKTWVYRFPGGSSNTVSKMDIKECIRFINDNDFTYYDWNVSSQDSATVLPTADEIVTTVMSEIADKDSAIVLMHDSDKKVSTVEALPRIIEKLQELKIEILPITDETITVHHVKVE